ncbi:MAG TPA: hypothetical protein VGJ60_24295 [Chloroflexota bacterium]
MNVSPTVRDGIELKHPKFFDSELLARASIFAGARGQYLWDIDLAFADGVAAYREAVQAWRDANRTPPNRSAWPSGPADIQSTVAEARQTVDRMRNSQSPKSTSGPPAPDLFVREDVSKPENRVNLALFSLMLVPRFREWFLERLGLDTGACVYPPQNQPGGRPDFVVVGPDSSVLAWIEVELGGENTAQLRAYRHALDKPVKSLIGIKGSGGDLTLDEISTRVNELSEDFDRQQAMNAGVLTQLIAELAGGPTAPQYREPSDRIRQRPLMQELQKRLGSAFEFGIPPVRPGTVQVGSMSETGWTLRVFSSQASGGSVQLMNRPTNAPLVRIPALEHLRRYLPLATVAVERYARLMLNLGIDISKIGGQQHMPVSEEALMADVDELAECVRALAVGYSGTSSMVHRSVH